MKNLRAFWAWVIGSSLGTISLYRRPDGAARLVVRIIGPDHPQSVRAKWFGYAADWNMEGGGLLYAHHIVEDVQGCLYPYKVRVLEGQAAVNLATQFIRKEDECGTAS